MAVDEAITDKAGLVVSLEFVAALLRSTDTLRRYGADLGRRLAELYPEGRGSAQLYGEPE